MLAITRPLSRLHTNTTCRVVASPINNVLGEAKTIFDSFLETYSPEHYRTKSHKEKQLIEQTFRQVRANYDRFVSNLPNLNSDSLPNLKQVLKTGYGVNVDTGKLTWNEELSDQSISSKWRLAHWVMPSPSVLTNSTYGVSPTGIPSFSSPPVEALYESIEFAQLQSRVSNMRRVPSKIKLGIEVLKTNGTKPGCEKDVERLLKGEKNRKKKVYYRHLLAYINNPTDDMKEKIARFLNKLLDHKEKRGIYIAFSG